MRDEAVKRDTPLPDDPFDLETSGALPMEGSFFLAKEAGTPLSSGLAGAEVDFSFLDGAVDEYAPRSPVRHVPVFMETRTWSSLAIVLLLHATLACIFPVFGKPPANGPSIIEAQLVLLPGGSGRAGGQPAQGGTKTPKGAKSVSPAAHVPAPPPPPRVQAPPPAAPLPAAPSAAARVKRKPLKPDRAARVHKILRPVRKIHARARKRPHRVARVLDHAVHRKKAAAPQPEKLPQTEHSAVRSKGSKLNAPAPAPGTAGRAEGALARGAAGRLHGPGGAGASDVAFGSPDGPRFRRKVAPAYPALARKLGKQGTVLLRVTIDARGRPVKVEVLRKAGFGMDEAAVKAVEQSTFVPAKKDGKPFTCKALLPIKFVLDSW